MYAFLCIQPLCFVWKSETPKHAGLATSMCHLTGPKQLLNVLNGTSKFSTLEEIEAVDTSLAVEVIAKSNMLGVVTPYNIWPGKFLYIKAASSNGSAHRESGSLMSTCVVCDWFN